MTDVAEERTTIEAHLEYGKAGGEAGMKLAIDAIAEGKGIDAKLQAQYTTAQIAKGQQDLRGEDDADAESVTDEASAKKKSEGEDEADYETKTHEALFAHLGVE